MERLEGRAPIPVTWEELDADYALKLPALFHPCLEVLTAAITGAFDLFGMGRRGIAPITNYLEIGATGRPIALGRPLEMRYTVELLRAARPSGASDGDAQSRLLLDQRATLHGFHRSGSATALGFDDGSGGPVEAGDFRLVQVFTRPFAPAGERRVTEVPEEFAKLRERAAADPPPSPEQLRAVPPGAEALGPETDMERVWGRGHTDINHHVTVAEHLRLLEAALVRRVAEAGLPVAAHRTARIACLFRRPFFAGEHATVRARLLREGARTLLLGGTYRRPDGGECEPRPSVAARLEGAIESEAGHSD